MHDLLENILNDIYTLDPSLREQEADVRALVLAFLAEKPTIQVDKEFAKSLRESLVMSKSKSVTKVASPFGWWIYLTPIGVAVLILMLVPSRPTPLAPTELPTPAFENSLELQSEPAIELYDAPSAKRSVETSSEDASMMMQMSADSLPTDSSTNSLIISDQNPGQEFVVDSVSLSLPGFVVILSDDTGTDDRVAGVSELLQPGFIEQIIIPLTITTQPGRPFSAVLIHDNGNGVYDQDLDVLVYDTYGAPVVQIFFTAPILLE